MRVVGEGRHVGAVPGQSRDLHLLLCVGDGVTDEGTGLRHLLLAAHHGARQCYRGRSRQSQHDAGRRDTPPGALPLRPIQIVGVVLPGGFALWGIHAVSIGPACHTVGMATEGSGQDDLSHFVLSARDLAAYQQVAAWARLDAEVEEQLIRAPVHVEDGPALRLHLLTAHLWNPEDFYRDESDREEVPGLSAIDWDLADREAQMPQLTLSDMQVLHRHEHDVLYPKDWPHRDDATIHQHLPFHQASEH